MEWISVEDKLPKDGQDIFTWDGANRCIDKFTEGESHNFKIAEMVMSFGDGDTEESPDKVTHWMPLPDPPYR